jgi:hypothetical protein
MRLASQVSASGCGGGQARTWSATNGFPSGGEGAATQGWAGAPTEEVRGKELPHLKLSVRGGT